MSQLPALWAAFIVRWGPDHTNPNDGSGFGSLRAKRDWYFGLGRVKLTFELRNLKQRTPLNTTTARITGDSTCKRLPISATTAAAPLDLSLLATGECGSAARRTRRRINIVSPRGPVPRFGTSSTCPAASTSKLSGAVFHRRDQDKEQDIAR